MPRGALTRDYAAHSGELYTGAMGATWRLRARPARSAAAASRVAAAAAALIAVWLAKAWIKLGASQDDRNPRLAHPPGVVLALVAERVETGGRQVGRR